MNSLVDKPFQTAISVTAKSSSILAIEANKKIQIQKLIKCVSGIQLYLNKTKLQGFLKNTTINRYPLWQ